MSDGVLELRVAWEQSVGRGAGATEAFTTVLSHYREPHRHYHTDRHLRWVVRHVTELAADQRVDDLGSVVVAAFYHDVVYDPRASDNEAASARVARTALQALGWHDDRIDRVADLITGTATHDVGAAERGGADAAVLYAADLSVLAATPTKYEDYVRNVRREYAHVDDAHWVDGRRAVLRTFLDRPAIYAPRLRLDTWERRARGNITAELQAMTG